jgi:hypothetical protein
MTDMTTETSTATGSGQDATVEEKINQLRELFADAPEVGRAALVSGPQDGGART